MSGSPKRASLPEPHWLFLLAWSTAFPLVLSLATKWGSRATVLVSVASVLVLLMGSVLPAARRTIKSSLVWGGAVVATILATLVGVLVLVPAVTPRQPQLVGDAAKDASLEGSVGVANATSGDKRYGSYAEQLHDGDHLAIQLYTRNMSASADVTPTFSWSCKELVGGALLFFAKASAPNFAGWEGVVTLSAGAGRRVGLEGLGASTTIRTADIGGKMATIETGVLAKKQACDGETRGAKLSSQVGRDVMTLKLSVVTVVGFS